MANALYDLARAAFANAGINWVSDTINVALVSSGYTPNLATHQYVSDLGANRLGTDQTLASKTNVKGLCSAAAAYWPSTPGSGTAAYLAVYKSTGVAGTSPLIGLIDHKELVTCASAASASQTTVKVDALIAPIASGTAIVFSGGTTATLSAAASLGDRSITVSALAGAIAANETGLAVTVGVNPLPLTMNGGSVTYTPDATYGIFKL